MFFFVVDQSAGGHNDCAFFHPSFLKVYKHNLTRPVVSAHCYNHFPCLYHNIFFLIFHIQCNWVISLRCNF